VLFYSSFLDDGPLMRSAEQHGEQRMELTASSTPSGDAIEREIVHAPAEAGEGCSPCCGLSLDQLPRYDRISFDPRQVTCGRLSDAEASLLSGQPAVLDPGHQQALFTMSAAVSQSTVGAVSLIEALNTVTAAMREILPLDRPLETWTAALMARVTDRALELVRS
jgi:hypothetical protein